VDPAPDLAQVGTAVSTGTSTGTGAGSGAGGGDAGRSRRRRRDRHGRGLRGQLLSATVRVGDAEVRVPASQTRGERFDELVLDAVEQLEERWARELEGVEFAVEDVPLVPADPAVALDDDVVADETAGGAVPLGRLLPAATDPRGHRTPARVVVYRRPLEVRAADRLDLAELVHDVVVDQVARLLRLDPDEVDPPR
jgi:predicted Zn-dependent protease with MMP-like domain